MVFYEMWLPIHALTSTEFTLTTDELGEELEYEYYVALIYVDGMDE